MPEKRDQKETDKETRFSKDSSENPTIYLSGGLSKTFAKYYLVLT